MDYKQLLIKYMRHIADLEGVTYTDRASLGETNINFTAEEREELRDLAHDEVI